MAVSKTEQFDLALWAAEATSIGEINVTSIEDLVSQVSQKVGAGKLEKLTIIGHGSETSFTVGKTEVAEVSKKIWGKLKQYFSKNGFIEIEACYVGNAKTLLKLIAQMTGVPVYAYTGYVNPITGIGTGNLVVVNSKGKIEVINPDLPEGAKPMTAIFDY